MEENAAYFNARISAMKEKLFPMLTYEKMLLMELPEITRYISEGDYNEDITELSKSFKGIDLIEYALNLNLARTFQKLINISQGHTQVHGPVHEKVGCREREVHTPRTSVWGIIK
ncbi:MAG TPA: V-type ATPase subunit [Candidatus Methanofastidiosa archaeon]|nr:V-type ATPase subunit [Candidatus Methanofastidiosa archaeon]